MQENVVTYLFTQGVLGIACIVLGVVAVKLYNKTDRLEKEKSTLMEDRRLDYKEISKDLAQVVSDNSQNMRILSEKIEVGKSIERKPL